MRKIFDAGNMNVDGICRRGYRDWISRSMAGQVITSRYDLSSAYMNKNRGVYGNNAVGCFLMV
jgi:hypothetical protein